MIASMTQSSASMASDQRVAQVIAFYETLSPDTLAHLDAIYADDARFVDPFNDVTGQAAIGSVFAHMFATLDAPTFDVVQAVTEGDHCFLTWDFSFRRKGRPTTAVVHGASHLRFAADGRIAMHRDYWDPARDLYEDLPLLGAVLRWLRHRLAAPG